MVIFLNWTCLAGLTESPALGRDIRSGSKNNLNRHKSPQKPPKTMKETHT